MRRSRDILILYTWRSLRVNLCHDKTCQESHPRGISAVYKKCFRSLWGRRVALVWSRSKAFSLSLSFTLFFIFPFLNKSSADKGKTPCRKTDNKITSSLKYRRKMRGESLCQKFAAAIQHRDFIHYYNRIQSLKCYS